MMQSIYRYGTQLTKKNSHTSGILCFEETTQGLPFDDENYILNLLFGNLSNFE